MPPLGLNRRCAFEILTTSRREVTRRSSGFVPFRFRNPVVLAFAAMKTTALSALGLFFAAALTFAQAPAPAGDPAFAKFVDDYFAARYAASPLAGNRRRVPPVRREDAGSLARRDREAHRRAARRSSSACSALDRAKLAVRRRASTPRRSRARSGRSCSTSRRCATGSATRWRTPASPGFAVNDLMKRDFAPKAGPAALDHRAPEGRSRDLRGRQGERRRTRRRSSRRSRSGCRRARRASSRARWPPGPRTPRAATPRSSRSSTTPTARPSPPLNDFAAWLEKDLAPRSNGKYAIGAENFSAKLTLRRDGRLAARAGARDRRGATSRRTTRRSSRRRRRSTRRRRPPRS